MCYHQHQPNKVGDDQQLNHAVDDADGPALNHHRLGGFVGEEVCDAGPHGVPLSVCVLSVCVLSVCVLSVCQCAFCQCAVRQCAVSLWAVCLSVCI